MALTVCVCGMRCTAMYDILKLSVCACVFAAQQSRCDLHPVSYLNFCLSATLPPRPPSLLSKVQTLSNGNQSDVTSNLSPD